MRGGVVRRVSRAIGSSRLSQQQQQQRRWLTGVASARAEESSVFPNERYGVDYGTNWAVASAGVTLGAEQLAFRNPSFKTGCAFASEKLDAKSGILPRSSASSSVYVPPQMDADAFDDIGVSARDAASASKSGATFVIDAGIGGTVAAGANVRAITDCASTALVLQNLLCGVPKQTAGRFVPAVQLVHAAAPDEAAGGEPYVASLGSQVAARGAVEPSALVEGLASAASNALAGEALVLVGSVYQEEGGETILVVGERSSPKGQTPVVQYHVIWGPRGLSRAWDFSLAAPGAAPKGSVGSSVCVVPNGYAGPAQLPHPSRVLFATKQGAKLGKGKPVESEEAVGQLLAAASAGGDHASDLELLNKLVQTSGASLAQL